MTPPSRVLRVGDTVVLKSKTGVLMTVEGIGSSKKPIYFDRFKGKTIYKDVIPDVTCVWLDRHDQRQCADFKHHCLWIRENGKLIDIFVEEDRDKESEEESES